jgi:hypothetical protein
LQTSLLHVTKANAWKSPPGSPALPASAGMGRLMKINNNEPWMAQSSPAEIHAVFRL